MGVRGVRWIIAGWILLVAVGLLLAFGARGAGPLPGDLLSARILQGLPWPGGVAGVLLSNAESAVWLLLVIALAVTLLSRRWLAALLVFVATLIAVVMGQVLKMIVARPRPAAELVQVYDPSQDYGFPSTTALISIVLFGVIAYLIWSEQPPRFVSIAALGIASALVVVIGLSRVYVGAHWLSDVLGGWLFGAAWLLLVVAAHRWLSRRGVSRNARKSRYLR
ncbi:MAG: phosphatase PAP2 family protein [Rubrobacteraceae bacterium]